jgi:hypothetical protein
MGMRALRDRNGAFPPVRQYDAVTSIITEGQLVFLSTTGLAQGVGTAALASTVRNLIGVASHHKALAATAGARKIQVYVDPHQLYVMQADDASLDSRTDYIGRNFQITLPSGKNTTNLQSIAEIDASTGTSASLVATTARPIQIVELWRQVGNAAVTGGTASSNADFVVRILPRYHLFAGSKGV